MTAAETVGYLPLKKEQKMCIEEFMNGKIYLLFCPVDLERLLVMPVYRVPSISAHLGKSSDDSSIIIVSKPLN